MRKFRGCVAPALLHEASRSRVPSSANTGITFYSSKCIIHIHVRSQVCSKLIICIRRYVYSYVNARTHPQAHVHANISTSVRIRIVRLGFVRGSRPVHLAINRARILCKAAQKQVYAVASLLQVERC